MPNVFLDAIKPVAPTVTTHEGGDAYAADKWSRLRRFLVIGTEGGTFYASQRDLTLGNISVLQDCLNEDALRTVNTIEEVSDQGLAVRADPCIFALSVVVSRPEVGIRKLGYSAIPTVIRTGTHLLHFMAYCKAQRKSSAGLRRAVGRWFTDKSADQLAYQAIKYQQRDGWSLADVLKLARPTAENEAQNAVLKWIVSGEVNQYAPRIIHARSILHGDCDLPGGAHEAASIIRYDRLPREAVPTQYLNDPDVWDALLQDMPITATIRNLAKMTSVGLLEGRDDAVKLVISRITDEERLQKGRVHPISLLNALRVYEQGHGDKGKLTWKPVKAIVKALDEAFYLAFKAVEPTNKRILLALDVSGSMMYGGVSGMALSPRDVAAAMALVTAAREPQAQIVAYSHTLIPLNIRPSMRLDEVMRLTKTIPFGGTICSLPFAWADHHGLTFDAFVSYTDSETMDRHYQRNLATYRKSRNKNARAAVVAMEANSFTLADPFDPRQLDVAGFSADTPAVLSDFFAGRV